MIEIFIASFWFDYEDCRIVGVGNTRDEAVLSLVEMGFSYRHSSVIDHFVLLEGKWTRKGREGL